MANAREQDERVANPGKVAASQRAGESEIQDWLVARLAAILELDPDQIDVTAPFDGHGLSSSEAVGLSGELGEWLGRELSPTLAWEFPTVAALALHLATIDAEPTRGDERDDKSSAPEPIAVVGIGCRFPGANGPAAFWELLRDGVDAIGAIPNDRPHLAAAVDPDGSAPGTMRTSWGGFLADIDRFDASFFGIAPREAARMDPQQRLLLEVAWEALEDAGLPPDRLAGTTTGVFVGISSSDYGQLQLSDPATIDPYVGTGNAPSVAANRLSFVLDLAGPSLAVDTACSSSLVATHLACQSLLHRESSLALVGGVNVMLTPAITINFDQAGAMAADGRCKTFDARADGYVRGEGAGVVVLKRLSDALADRDRIYATILGSAVNQDGRSNGLMAPNPERQEEVLTEAYRRAGVSPGEVQYVEAHGTGTLLGDPIEVGALARVVSRDRRAGQPCTIGSVKTNIGHLEAAAGIAGLIKVALALHHDALPASLHFAQPNPHIPFDRLPVRVQCELAPWPDHDGPALAGVSSFGFGGTNVHVVLQGVAGDTERSNESEPANEAVLLPLSARDRNALRALAAAYRDHLSSPGLGTPLPAIAATASLRRIHHDLRLAVAGASHADLAAQLGAYLAGETRPGLATGRRDPHRRHRVVFVFSGHGSQWTGMGRELLVREPVFREALAACDEELRPLLGWSVIDQLRSDDPVWLDRVELVQPCIYAVQVALAALWRSWGVRPDAVVGHSLGEVAAAQVAGALSPRDAAGVVAARSRLLQTVAGQGRTATLALPAAEVDSLIAGREELVGIAALNGPRSTVIAGEADAVDVIVAAAMGAGVFGRAVRTDVAFHSPQMDTLRPELEAALGGLAPRLPDVPIYSTVTGTATQGRQFDAVYWGRHLRQPVRFAAAIERLLSTDHDIFLEIAPHPLLRSAIEESLEHWKRPGRVLESLRRGTVDRAALLGTAGALYALGLPLDWHALSPNPGVPVDLPRYPWQRERYWFDPSMLGRNDDARARSRGVAAAHPLLGRRLDTAHPTWEAGHSADRSPVLASSSRGGTTVIPASAVIAMALASSSDPERAEVRDLRLDQPQPSTEQGTVVVQLVHTGESDGDTVVEVFIAADELADAPRWRRHASARLTRSSTDQARGRERLDLEAIRARCISDVALETFQRSVAVTGLVYRGLDISVTAAWRRDGEALVWLRRGNVPAAAAADWIVPAMIEAAARALVVAAPEIPAGHVLGVDHARLANRLPETVIVHARARQHDDHATELTGDIRLFDGDGEWLAEVNGVWFAPAQELDAVQTNLSRDALLTLDAAGRAPAVIDFFRGELARVLGTPPERIEADRPLDTFGLDSMMALLLVGRVERTLGVTLSVVDLLLGPTLEELSAIVLEQLSNGDGDEIRRSEAGSPGPTAPSDLERDLARLGELSDDELEALLTELASEMEQERGR